jgi:hypothetical protein
MWCRVGFIITAVSKEFFMITAVKSPNLYEVKILTKSLNSDISVVLEEACSYECPPWNLKFGWLPESCNSLLTDHSRSELLLPNWRVTVVVANTPGAVSACLKMQLLLHLSRTPHVPSSCFSSVERNEEMASDALPVLLQCLETEEDPLECIALLTIYVASEGFTPETSAMCSSAPFVRPLTRAYDLNNFLLWQSYKWINTSCTKAGEPLNFKTVVHTV